MQLLCKGAPSPGYPRGHGAQRNPEPVCDLLIPKTLEVKHHHGLALSFRQSIDRREEPALSSFLVDLIVGVRGGIHEQVDALFPFFVVVGGMARSQLRPSPGAQVIDGDVPCDAEQPRAKGFVGPKARLAFEGPTQRFARAIFHVGVVSSLTEDGGDDSPHDGEQGGDIRPELVGYREGGKVAGGWGGHMNLQHPQPIHSTEASGLFHG